MNVWAYLILINATTWAACWIGGGPWWAYLVMPCLCAVTIAAAEVWP